MGVYKPAAQSYMIGLIMAASALAGYSLFFRAWPDSPALAPFIVLTVMAAVSHLYPIRSAREGTFYVVANVFVFAAVVLLPTPLLTLHALLTMIPFSLWHHRRPRIWYRWAFNTAQTMLTAHAAHWLLQGTGWRTFDGPASLVVVLAAMVLFPVFQGSMVAVMLFLNNGVRFADAEPLQQDALLSEVIMTMLGGVVAALWHAQPWFIALLPVPVLITYSLMRRVQMVRLVDFDSKTGLYNYRYFEQSMDQEFARARPVRRPTALMFMDLDYLRHINNRYGHLAGDHVLKEVASILTRHLRAGDLVARFGGEEFVAMLPGTDRTEATYLAERIRRAVEIHTYHYDDHQIRATISIGVVAYPVDGEEPADLIRRADELLYMAKAGGRNRVQAAGTERCPTTHSHEERRPALAPLPSMLEAAASLPSEMVPVQVAPAERSVQEAPHHDDQPVPSLQANWFTMAVPWAFAVAGLLLGAWVGLNTTWPYPKPYTLVVLVGVAFVAELVKVQVYDGDQNKISISFGTGAIAAGVAALDTAGALAVALVGVLTHVLVTRRYHLDKISFNAGNIVLSTIASVVVLRQFPMGPEISLNHLLGPGLSAVTFYVVNTGLLCLVIAVRARRNMFLVWQDNLWYAPADILSGLMGAFLGAASSILGLVGTAVFLTPIMVLRQSFSLYARRTQQSISELKQAKSEAETANYDKERTLDQMIVTVAAIIDARDRSVFGHSRQVARYAVALAEEMGLPGDLVQRIRIAALLHDLGKIGIPESILHKPSRLTAEEFAIIQHHAPLGAQILAEVMALQDVARMVGEHHEQYGGGGYPFGKSGEEITIGGRIIAVADTLDTILSDRPYSRAKPLSWALDEFQRCAGSQFDPQVVQALLKLVAKQDRSFFVNSSRTAEDKVRNLFTVAGGRTGEASRQ